MRSYIIKTIGTLLISLMLLVAACNDKSAKTPKGPADYPASSLLKIRPGVELEIVDWGGDGPPMVFLAGLGHTAHVFAEFAPRFADEFKVIGITRRGFGASSQPETGYSLDTLADDIRIVLDELDLEDVILVGHSLGGDEITRFVKAYPDLARAAIYLDAAYDRTTSNDTLANYPVPDLDYPEATAEDLKTPEGYQAFYERANGVKMPLKEIEELYFWTDDSSFGGGKTPGSIYGQISQSLTDPVYDGITLPALAVYGVDYPIEELFMDFAKADSVDQVMLMAYYDAVGRTAAASRQRFRDRMTNGSVVEIPGAGHSLYITHATETEKAMRRFLGGTTLPRK